MTKFLDSEDTPVPAPLSHAVKGRVHGELRAENSRVWKKMALIQITAGGLTLLVCPQFGIGPLGGGHGIMHFVMDYGVVACGSFCGSVFAGAGYLMAPLLLTRTERARVFRLGIRLSLALSLGAWALLMGIGATLGQGDFDPAFSAVWVAAGTALGPLLLSLQRRVLPA